MVASVLRRSFFRGALLPEVGGMEERDASCLRSGIRTWFGPSEVLPVRIWHCIDERGGGHECWVDIFGVWLTGGPLLLGAF